MEKETGYNEIAREQEEFLRSLAENIGLDQLELREGDTKGGKLSIEVETNLRFALPDGWRVIIEKRHPGGGVAVYLIYPVIPGEEKTDIVSKHLHNGDPDLSGKILGFIKTQTAFRAEHKAEIRKLVRGR